MGLLSQDYNLPSELMQPSIVKFLCDNNRLLANELAAQLSSSNSTGRLFSRLLD